MYVENLHESVLQRYNQDQIVIFKNLSKQFIHNWIGELFLHRDVQIRSIPINFSTISDKFLNIAETIVYLGYLKLIEGWDLFKDCKSRIKKMNHQFQNLTSKSNTRNFRLIKQQTFSFKEIKEFTKKSFNVLINLTEDIVHSMVFSFCLSVCSKIC